MGTGKTPIGACQYSVVSTSVAIYTGKAYLLGVTAFCKTTGDTNVLIYDATATNTGNLIVSAATTGTGVATTVMFTVPVAMTSGIWCNMARGTTAADSATVLYIKA